MRWYAVALIALCVDVRTAAACAAAPPAGHHVLIGEEEALIVGDPATKTEHFIRRAAFRSTARKFGFLVPTPTVPQLSEVPDSIFSILGVAIRPEIKIDRSETEYELGSIFSSCMLTCSKSAQDDVRAGNAVRVLATAQVAGFNATTVEADDAKALTDWLGNHGFEATPQLTAWLERYVKDKWKMTAFVVASEQAQGDQFDVATRAVKMTFPSERPFYPYREPQIEMTVESTAKLAPPTEGRMLRVYFVSNERYAATLADKAWSATVLQAKPLTYVPPELEAIVGAHRFMTVFVDESSPRRGIEELYFAPSANQAQIHQPPTVIADPKKVTIPVDLLAVFAAFLIWIAVKIRRR